MAEEVNLEHVRVASEPIQQESKLNVENIKMLIRLYSTPDANVKMCDWGDIHESYCGTAHCIGGLASALSYEEEKERVGKENVQQFMSVERRAEIWLGLSKKQANSLFFMKDYSDDNSGSTILVSGFEAERLSQFDCLPKNTRRLVAKRVLENMLKLDGYVCWFRAMCEVLSEVLFERNAETIALKLKGDNPND